MTPITPISRKATWFNLKTLIWKIASETSMKTYNNMDQCSSIDSEEEIVLPNLGNEESDMSNCEKHISGTENDMKIEFAMLIGL